MDVTGDWVIEGTVRSISNETINVTGAIIVRDGGELRLDNCIVSLDRRWPSQGRMIINASGRLHANGTRITGVTGGECLTLAGDTEMDGCYVARVRNSDSLGVIIYGSSGNVTLKDTVFERIIGGCIYSRRCLRVSGCSFRDIAGTAIFIDNQPSTTQAQAVIAESTIAGIGDRRSGGPCGIYVISGPYGTSGLSLVVKGTILEDWSYGIYITSIFTSDIVVEGCEILDNMVGIRVMHTYGTLAIRSNLVGRCQDDNTIGMDIMGDSDFITLEDNVVERVRTGYRFRDQGLSMPGYQYWRGLEVRDCGWGVYIMNTDSTYSLNVEINGSRFQNITEPYGTFVASDAGGCVDLWVSETEHTPGSAMALSTGCYLYGYLLVDVKGVRWLDGPDILEGGLTLWDARPSLHYIDISRPRPVSVLLWQASYYSNSTLAAITPHMEFYGSDFKALSVPISSGRGVELVVEVIDDAAPEATIDSPVPGSVLGTAHVEVHGTQSDVGTGLSRIELALDDGATIDCPWAGPWQWNFLLTGLAEGMHVLGARAVDRASNVGRYAWTSFTVDTVPPTLDIRPCPAIVGTEDVSLEGRTEAGSNLTINGVICPVGEDGSFSRLVALEEGTNLLFVRAVDHAGHVNSTILTVVRDTQGPVLTIASPLNGTWTNATSVVVTGYVSLDASLEVNDAAVAFWTGRFSCELPLTEGMFEVAVRAVDRAGNEAHAAVVLNVDWTPPRLEVFSPDRDIVHTTAGYIEFFGEVHDTALDALTVNGTAIAVFMDRFLTGFSVPEGRTSFVLRAEDLAGNSVTRSFTVHRDITLPNCTVELVPIGGEMRVVQGKRLVTTPAVEVRVLANEDVMVALGNLVKGPCRECEFHVTLEEGPNALAVTVHDLAGNMVTPFSWLVTLDTMTPPLEVRSPHQGLLTSRDRVIVEGLTEPGAVLTVEGKVRAVDDQGFFRLEVPLRKGSNVIDVAVSDAAGHVNSTAIEVTREQGFGQLAEDMGSSAALATVLVLALLILMLARYRFTRTRERSGQDGEGDEPPAHKNSRET